MVIPNETGDPGVSREEAAALAKLEEEERARVEEEVRQVAKVSEETEEGVVAAWPEPEAPTP